MSATVLALVENIRSCCRKIKPGRGCRVPTLEEFTDWVNHIDSLAQQITSEVERERNVNKS